MAMKLTDTAKEAAFQAVRLNQCPPAVCGDCMPNHPNCDCRQVANLAVDAAFAVMPKQPTAADLLNDCSSGYRAGWIAGRDAAEKIVQSARGEGPVDLRSIAARIRNMEPPA